MSGDDSRSSIKRQGRHHQRGPCRHTETAVRTAHVHHPPHDRREPAADDVRGGE
ncbi:hypothetical protein [Streptomyces incarnatus]|nr:hypothetical protein [Streptomyces incarnatus]